MRADPDAVIAAIAAAVAATSAERDALRIKDGAPDGKDGRVVDRFRLYDPADVRAAMGEAEATEDDGYDGDPEERGPPPRDDTEHRARLRAILARGQAGAWRTLVGPRPDALEHLEELGSRAPHLCELTALVSDHVKAALTVGMPLTLPPILLVGGPGTGKTWFLSRLAQVLDVPFRPYQLSSSSLGDGLSGSHPSWRNAKMGLCATMQLTETVANGLVFVDESDKPSVHLHEDPYRPFYALLDPSNSRKMVDEYLGFPMDLSALSWMLSANESGAFPAPILDRLTIIEVPPLTQGQLTIVAASIYRDANVARRGFFDAELGTDVMARLMEMNPRAMRIALDAAMVRAAADGRRTLLPADIRDRAGARRCRVGFIR